MRSSRRALASGEPPSLDLISKHGAPFVIASSDWAEPEGMKLASIRSAKVDARVD